MRSHCLSTVSGTWGTQQIPGYLLGLPERIFVVELPGWLGRPGPLENLLQDDESPVGCQAGRLEHSRTRPREEGEEACDGSSRGEWGREDERAQRWVQLGYPPKALLTKAWAPGCLLPDPGPGLGNSRRLSACFSLCTLRLWWVPSCWALWPGKGRNHGKALPTTA